MQLWLLLLCAVLHLFPATSQSVQTNVNKKALTIPCTNPLLCWVRQIWVTFLLGRQNNIKVPYREGRAQSWAVFLLWIPQGTQTCKSILFSFSSRSLQDRMRSLTKDCCVIALGFLNSKLPELRKLTMVVGGGKDRQVIILSYSFFNAQTMFYILLHRCLFFGVWVRTMRKTHTSSQLQG